MTSATGQLGACILPYALAGGSTTDINILMTAPRLALSSTSVGTVANALWTPGSVVDIGYTSTANAAGTVSSSSADNPVLTVFLTQAAATSTFLFASFMINWELLVGSGNTTVLAPKPAVIDLDDLVRGARALTRTPGVWVSSVLPFGQMAYGAASSAIAAQSEARHDSTGQQEMDSESKTYTRPGPSDSRSYLERAADAARDLRVIASESAGAAGAVMTVLAPVLLAARSSSQPALRDQ